MSGKSKYYYEFDRNTSSTTNINPKMRMSKEELGLEKKHETVTGALSPTGARSIDTKRDNRVPYYYIGRNGYEARKVCDNFDLPYHLATATTYILRSYHKHDTPVDCLKKAIAHLEFELEKIEDAKANL
jgi:hypothetical protein|tara:strand:+ start:776 stop:1162 length:387 start_codon:yes stop_codon:yes gene_type:complete